MPENGYPTDEELEIIKNWDITKEGTRPLVEYICSIWEYPDRVRVYPSKDHFLRRRIMRFYLSTGGWSGNEEIMSAIRGNLLFWMMYWQKHIRGGHYWFNIPMVIWNKSLVKEG